jgi:hypothetical protein
MWYIVIILVIALFYYWYRIAILEAQRKALLNSLSSALLSSGKTPGSLAQDFLDKLNKALPLSDYNSLMKAFATAVQADIYRNTDGALDLKQEHWLRDALVRDINHTKRQLEDKAGDLSQYDVEGY